MSTEQPVERDERTWAVENASYRWAYSFVCFALLIDVMLRGWFRNEAAWDLMALACLPGIVCGIYQARQGILGGHWVRQMMFPALIALVASFVAAVIWAMTRGM